MHRIVDNVAYNNMTKRISGGRDISEILKKRKGKKKNTGWNKSIRIPILFMETNGFRFFLINHSL